MNTSSMKKARLLFIVALFFSSFVLINRALALPALPPLPSSDTTPPVTTVSSSGYFFGSWTNADVVAVGLSADDGDGTGVASGYPVYCVDTSNTCTPATSYTGIFNITCSVGSTCTQYVRYFSEDNAGNIETVNSAVVIQVVASASDATPPVARFVWTVSKTADYSINFDASASTCPAGTTCTCSWSTGETGITSSHQFNDSTTTIITLTVSNSNGSGTASMAVTPKYVASTPTSVSMTASMTGYTISGTYSVSGGIAPYTVTAKWGDGTTSTLSSGTFTHTYANAGTYTVTISATDSGDNGSYKTTGSASQIVTISAATSTISGTVTRADGTTPLSGALVLIKGPVSFVQITKADGTYNQGSLKPGTYTVSVTKSGYTFPTSPQAGVTPSAVVNFRSSF